MDWWNIDISRLTYGVGLSLSCNDLRLHRHFGIGLELSVKGEPVHHLGQVGSRFELPPEVERSRVVCHLRLRRPTPPNSSFWLHDSWTELSISKSSCSPELFDRDRTRPHPRLFDRPHFPSHPCVSLNPCSLTRSTRPSSHPELVNDFL